MIRVCGASAFVAVSVILFTTTDVSADSKRTVLFGCTGMKLVQSAAPDDRAPDANSGAPPDDGSVDGNSRSPGDDDGTGDDDGANSDQASPPDSVQPPGCIFRNEPLELLV
jgi:hypothetical protein